MQIKYYILIQKTRIVDFDSKIVIIYKQFNQKDKKHFQRILFNK
jgi:hypothetical protein